MCVCVSVCVVGRTLLAAPSCLPAPPQVAGLATKHRLLHSLVAAWPRRGDRQLLLTSGRTGVVQALCNAVEERAPAVGDHSTPSMGGVLWHSINVSFYQIRRGSACDASASC